MARSGRNRKGNSFNEDRGADMKKLLTVVFATLFAVSTGAFAAAHMKGEKDAKADKMAQKGDKAKTSKKGAAKDDMKKGKK
jgi:hypothetical protein